MKKVYELGEHRIQKMQEYGIPSYMHGGLIRYYENLSPPGGFLSAVLENDLMGALNQADGTNRHALHAYGMWIYNCAPIGTYGSKEAVDGWLAGTSKAAQDLQKEEL